MGNYATAEDIRGEGLNDPKVTNARINARIVKWEQICERMTGQVWRTVSPGEIIFDGNNDRILHFSLPIITVTSVKVNGSTTALAASKYRVHNGTSPPKDDRMNPKIELLPGTDSLFETRHDRWLKGYDQAITATWGHLEGGATPAPIKEAIKQLVLMDLDGYFDRWDSGLSAPAVAPVRRERTDGHEIEYGQDRTVAVWALIPRDIKDMIMLYRGPWQMGVPNRPLMIDTTFVEAY